MKRRELKKHICKEKQSLADTLKDCFASVGILTCDVPDTYKDRLSSDLVYLIMGTLSLGKSQWPYRERWIDGIDWDYLTVTDKHYIKGKGVIWWGYRNNYNIEFPSPFEAELGLKIKKNKRCLAYKLLFEVEGILYQVSN